jgi:hypothetical protein
VELEAIGIAKKLGSRLGSKFGADTHPNGGSDFMPGRNDWRASCNVLGSWRRGIFQGALAQHLLASTPQRSPCGALTHSSLSATFFTTTSPEHSDELADQVVKHSNLRKFFNGLLVVSQMILP